jgi:outer membrane protein TolC
MIKRLNLLWLTGCAAALAAVLTGAEAWTQQVQDKGTAPAVAGAPPRVYDLRLAIETALKNYPAVATAEARSQAAKTGIAVVGATYRPYIEGNITFNSTLAGDKNVVVTTEGFPVQGVSTEPTYVPSLSFITPIAREGGFVWNTLPSEKVAKALYENVAHNEQVVRKDLVSNVTTAFFTVLLRKEAVKVDQQLVDLNQALVKNARLRFAQKLIPKADVLAAESALATAEADLAIALTNLTVGLRDFAAVIGLDPSSDIVQTLELVDKAEVFSPLETLDDLLKQARTRHPLILAQEAILRQTLASLDLVKSERYPTLDSTFTLGAADNISSSSSLNSWNLRTNLRLTWKVYDFGLLNLKIKQQTETIEAEKRAVEQVRIDVTRSIVAAYGTFAGVQSQLQSVKKTVNLQEEVARAARVRFDQNLIPLSDLLQAQANLATAQRTLIETQYNMKIEHAKLIAAVGGQ